MSRSPQSLKQLLSPQQLKAHSLSLYNASYSLLSVLLSPLNFLKRFFSKPLRFLSSMDPFFFSLSSPSPTLDDDADVVSSDPSPPSPSPELLFLVPLRWWWEANVAMHGGVREIRGILYNVTARFSNKKLDKNDYLSEVESEIVLDMTRAGETGTSEEEGASGNCNGDVCLALISEWMFLRAFKWHNDMKDVGGFLAPAESLEDFFSLKIRLSFMCKTNSFFIRINQKDNGVRAFDRARGIFCFDSGLLKIWDFMGQTNQYFMNEQMLYGDSSQSGEEILLKLHLFGLLLVEAREMKRDKLMREEFKSEVTPSSGSLKINGSADVFNSFSRVKQSSLMDGGYGNACALGLAGLHNLGNTCFMNSTLQCLLHTMELVDYFLGDFHKDLNFENPLGMKGKLAISFGDLLRKLWTPGATAVAPKMFKSTIAGFAPRFSGYNQHDSQEFLAFLLDGLHEDLNRVKQKPSIEVKDGVGCPDEELPDEHWRNHLACNNSIIVDLCQGQYRSTLVCPVCKQLSVTFDPFMYLSLPLPSTTIRTMTLTVFSTDGSTLPSLVNVSVPKFGKFMDLVQALRTACSLGDDETLLVAEIYDSRIFRILEDPSDVIDLIRDDDRLVAYRLPKDSEGCHLVVFTHQHEPKSHFSGFSSRRRFGVPLVSRMSNFIEGSEIRKEFLKLLNPFLMPVEDTLNGNIDDQPTTSGGRVLDEGNLNNDADLHGELQSDSAKEYDFHFYLTDESLFKTREFQMDEPVSVSSTIVNVLVLWPEKMMEDYDISWLRSVQEVCKAVVLFSRKPQESVSLYKCLDAFLKEEPLGPEDMWYCPSCKTRQQASKKLDLWRLPEILVIHLKRFSYNRSFKNKLETLVDFPIDVFDLSSYMAHEKSTILHHYMLYAVSNHFGGMGSGHYTAFVKHGKRRWYEFDDANVFRISEEQLKTSFAYVLFYRRIPDTVHNI